MVETSDQTISRSPGSRWGTAIRRTLMLVVFLATTASTYQILVHEMAKHEIAEAFPAVYLGMLVDRQMNSLPKRTSDSPLRIGFLGDSTVQGYPEGLDVATQTGRALERRDPTRFEVLSFAQPGMGPLEFYALADSFLRSDVDAFVISFNIASLSPVARDFWARRSLVGWIPPERMLEASMLPMHWWGITLDRLLLYTGLIQADLVNRWFQYRITQLRAGNAIKTVRRRLQGIEADWASSLPPLPAPDHPTKPNRFAKPSVLQNLGDAARGVTTDHPVMAMLGGAIDVFRAHGVDVYVYATPTNVEHMEDVGIDTRAGVQTSIDSLARVVTAHDAHFNDLHRIFPDGAFRDPGNHLTYEGEILGPQALAERIAEWISAEIDTSRTRRKSS